MKKWASLVLSLAVVAGCSGAPLSLSVVDRTDENPVAGDLVISLTGDNGESERINLGDLSIKEYAETLINPSHSLQVSVVGANPPMSAYINAVEGKPTVPTLLVVVGDDTIEVTWGSSGTVNLARVNPVREARERISALSASTLAAVEPYVASLAKAISDYDKEWIKAAGSADKLLSWDRATKMYSKYAKIIRKLNDTYVTNSQTYPRSEEEPSIGTLIDAAATYGKMLYGCFHGADGYNQPSPATCYSLRSELKAALEASLALVRSKS
jgi:hypothetical protein